MLNGLDLFSGIGGLTVGLSEWVRPVAYCEIERYAQAVLLSRMEDGVLPVAPIWDDITTLKGTELKGLVDIIYGGFPCQDISVAGKGKGLAGERSGLFFEIMRLVNAVQPSFIFLENVPAITARGLGTVTAEITKAGYDCRWTTLSAAEVGAAHKRNRWWLLAHPKSDRKGRLSKREAKEISGPSFRCKDVADSNVQGLQRSEKARDIKGEGENGFKQLAGQASLSREYWETEPNVGRVADGIPRRVDRIKGLGNAVVPLQAKTAFEELMGISNAVR